MMKVIKLKEEIRVLNKRILIQEKVIVGLIKQNKRLKDKLRKEVVAIRGSVEKELIRINGELTGINEGLL